MINWGKAFVMPTFPFLRFQHFCSQSGLFCVHFQDQIGQQVLTLHLGMGVDRAGMTLAVGVDDAVTALPEADTGLEDAARTGTAAVALYRLKVIVIGDGGNYQPLGTLHAGDGPVDGISGLLLHIVRDMGVDVQCSGRGDVADDSGQGLDVHAVFQGEGGEGVAQIVEPQVLTACQLQNGVELFPHMASVNGLLRLDAGGEHPLREHVFLVLCQHSKHRLGQDDGPLSCLGLGRTDVEFAVDGSNLAVNMQRTRAEIQVMPLEPQQLTLPQARGQLYQKQLVEALFLGLDQEALHLIPGEDLHLLGAGGRQLAAHNGIGLDQMILHCLVQCHFTDGIATANGVGGQFGPVLIDVD